MNQHQGLDEDLVRSVYNEVANDYADRLRTTEAEQPLELAMIAHFVGLLGAQSPSVLDAGCGAGRMLPYLARLGCDPTGIDLSPAMVRRARSDHAQFTTSVANLTDLPFRDDSFDGFFSWYSLIHVADERIGRVLAEARRVLRPSGLALFAFQIGEGSREVGGAFRDLGHQVVLHRRHRSLDDVARALTAAGFSEVARVSRSPEGTEREPQGVIVARAGIDLTAANSSGSAQG